MATISDRLILKDRIISNIARSVKAIQEIQPKKHEETCSRSELLILTNDDHQSQKLIEHLDLLFLHGLKKLNHGYWNIVKEFTQKDSIKDILRSKNVSTELGRGRAWLMLALNECVLECYVNCFMDNAKIVKRHYVKEALVLDEERMHLLLTLTSGLECVVFQLNYDVPYLDIGTIQSDHRGRSNSGSSSLEDRVSLCSMDSIMAEKYPNGFPEKIDHRSEKVSTSDSRNLKTSSLDSGISISESATDCSDFGHHFKKPEDEVIFEDENEEVEVIRLNKPNKQRKKKHKKSKNSFKIINHDIRHEKQQSSQIHDSPEEEEEDAVSNSQHTKEEINKEKLVDVSSKNNDLHGAKKHEMKVELSREISEDSLDKEVLRRTNEHSKMNYNIACVELPSTEESDFDKDGGSSTFNSEHNSQNASPAKVVTHRTEGKDSPDSIIPKVFKSVENEKNYSDIVEEVVDFAEKSKGSFSDIYDLHLESKPQRDSIKLTSGSDSNVDKLPESSTNADVPVKLRTTPQSKKESDLQLSHSRSSSDQMKDRVNEIINQPSASIEKTVLLDDTDDRDFENNDSQLGVVSLSNNTKLHLMLEICDGLNEKLIQTFVSRVGHTEGEARVVFVLISDKAIYLVSQTQGDHRFNMEACILFSALDYISLSIDSQVIHIVYTIRKRKLQHWITTGSQVVSWNIVKCIETEVENSGLFKPPPILTDASAQWIALNKYLAREMEKEKLDKVSYVCCYSLIHWDSPQSRGNNSDPGYREGNLLYKVYDRKSSLSSTLMQTVQEPSSLLYGNTWKSAYIVLRDSVLCIFASKSDSKPLHFVQLGSDDCTGCRRSSSTDRDHCIEIIKGDGMTYYLALASDIEAHDWLQSLCQAVATGSQKIDRLSECLPCCVILTQQKILMCHEDMQTNFFRTLGSANVADVTSVLTDIMDQSFCCLEFDSQDGKASNNEWILYFTNNAECQRFISALSEVWSNTYQVDISVLPFSDVTFQRSCRDVSSQLQNTLVIRE